MNTQPQAEFNMAGSDLDRLNKWFYGAEVSQATNNLQEWWHSLTNIYDIVYPYMSDPQIEEYDILHKNLEVSISNALNTLRKNPYLGINNKLHHALRDFYRRLRRIAKDSGILMRLSEDFMETENW